MNIPKTPAEPITLNILDTEDAFEGCPEGPEEPEIASETQPESLPCESSPLGSGSLFDTIELTPLGLGAGTSGNVAQDGNAVLAANTINQVDTVTRPLLDGALIFQTIRDASAPESFSWKVDLEEGQELKLLDSEHAEVYYAGGHPAFGITAEPAADAVGTTVPTHLSVEQPDTVTLTVEHRNRGSVYPVTAGSGWQGGFVSTEIEGPEDEQELRETEERIEREERERLESGEEWEGSVAYRDTMLILHASAVGPPVASASGATPQHRFKFSECRWSEVETVPDEPFNPPKAEQWVEVLGGCLR